MKSGDKIQTMAGTTVEFPYAFEHPCFGQSQEPPFCHNLATWRVEGKHLILHWCGYCKIRLDAEHKFETKGGFAWTKLEDRT